MLLGHKIYQKDIEENPDILKDIRFITRDRYTGGTSISIGWGCRYCRMINSKDPEKCNNCGAPRKR